MDLEVHKKAHLLALSSVSRKFRDIVFPRLFQALTIRAQDERQPWEFESYPYFAQDAINDAPEVLARVRKVRLCAPFKLTMSGPRKRCTHSHASPSLSSGPSSPRLQEEDDAGGRELDKYLDDLQYLEEGDFGLMKPATNLLRLLSALPDQQLTGFW